MLQLGALGGASMAKGGLLSVPLRMHVHVKSSRLAFFPFGHGSLVDPNKRPHAMLRAVLILAAARRMLIHSPRTETAQYFRAVSDTGSI
jgi:hypothetical protein